MSKAYEFFLVDQPGADRYFFWSGCMSKETQDSLKAGTPGTRIFRVKVNIPDREMTVDAELSGDIEEE